MTSMCSIICAGITFTIAGAANNRAMALIKNLAEVDEAKALR
jgi:hypothetical protein